MSLIHINNGDSGLDTRNKINNAFDMIDNLSTGSLINVTYSEAVDLISNSNLNEGFHYKITDRADAGIILLAVSTNQFSLEGQAIFLNPDFQAAGALGADVQGVWYVGGEAGYVNGNIVFWNGNHYVVTDDAAFAGTDPSATPLAYTLLTKSVANGYIEEVDFILYDFTNDTIIWQEDERGNKWNPDGVDSFQRGNDLYKNVYVNNGANIDSINQRGTILSITLFDTVTVVFDNTNEGQITGCTFGGGSIINCNFNLGKTLDLCSIAPIADITFDNTKSYAYKTINSLASNFEADLNMDSLSIYTGTQLIIPTNLNYVGIFTLRNNGAVTITKITNFPEAVPKIRFYIQAGNSKIFDHTAIGSAVADNLVSDAAAINTIVGRTNGSDFIEYEKAGNLNRRYNAVILA